MVRDDMHVNNFHRKMFKMIYNTEADFYYFDSQNMHISIRYQSYY